MCACEQEGAGLFMHGGNPVYYTMKGSSDDIARRVHSILRNSLDDLAGDHIVLRLSNDENTLQPFMYVHRTPLATTSLVIGNASSEEAASQQSQDPVESIYQFSKLSTRPTGGNTGWLYNLASEMRAEQKLVDRLYPLRNLQAGNNSTENKWACPLLRFAFWSKVVEDFSPLTPSPIRAARYQCTIATFILRKNQCLIAIFWCAGYLGQSLPATCCTARGRIPRRSSPVCTTAWPTC